MTQAEFRQWFVAHRATFASIGSWLKEFPKASEVAVDTDRPTQEKIAAAWFDVLADQPLAECLAATKLLAKGDEPPPKSWDLHPQTIRRIAKKLAGSKQGAPGKFRFGPKTRADGEETVNCLKCLDSGHVLIFHPESVNLIRKGVPFGNRGARCTAVALCSCIAGDERRKLRAGELIANYDESNHVRVESGRSYPNSDDLARLSEFLATEQSANYEPSFDAW